ncbi:nucleotide disphospho-sugar-binding domain-containing protein [Streptomyces sp. RerS4]|uniref:nucleotide disphospho-sugar-binding domain-containing protein n=1 Tax=Streptomyces sp. RerS4 TaxID=2942449 RepID=UPI00201BA09B|nr:nucleotide disphospho-sugar-binding domain-containing protein [Streptomyces sp. RerS4]UQX05460.1 DUF1205 domain-containing protein [Streptomyces sp. RerS4]
MRVLFVVTPVAGHLSPLTPLAWALRDAGHEVLVAGQPDVLPTAAAAGLHAVGVGDPFGMDEMLLDRLPAGRRLLQSWGRAPDVALAADFARSWAAHNTTVLPAYLDLARGFRPDLIVGDILEFTSLVLGGVLGVPVVHHRWGVDPLGDPTLLQAREAHRALCASVGLPALPEPDLLLDPCPPSLQLPGIRAASPIRHLHSHGNGTLPPWLPAHWAAENARTPAERTPTVLVSLGRSTLKLNGAPLFRSVLAAFGELPGTRALATVDAAHRQELGPLPPNVRLIDHTPLHMLFRISDAVVHHGGAGTSMSASYAGLPQLVLPQLADTFASAERLVHAGAALSLDTAAEQDDPATIARALSALLTEPHHARAARRLRTEMEAMPTPTRVVTDLERLVRDRDRAAATPHREEAHA